MHIFPIPQPPKFIRHEEPSPPAPITITFEFFNFNCPEIPTSDNFI